MNWNFIKTNWFSIALVILLLAAIIQGSGKLSLSGNRFGGSGKFTESIALENGATALGLATESRQSAATPREIDQATATAFFKRFAHVAISERKKFGVPASILLSIAFLNSHSGLNEASATANNFFGLPCSADWEGETAAIGECCVRKYETPWASWRDFSIHLTVQDWYASLRQSAGKDWKKWAEGIRGKDVSSVSNLNQKLEELIRFYHLYEIDQQ